MKFTSNILAVSLVQSGLMGAGAFFVNTPAKVQNTALYSSSDFSYSYLNGDETTTNSTRVESSTSSSSTTTPSSASFSTSTSTSKPVRAAATAAIGTTSPFTTTDSNSPSFSFSSRFDGEYVDEDKVTYNPALTIDANNLPSDIQLVKENWATLKPVTVQGGSLRTCVPPTSTNRVQVLLRTDGRPLNSNVELWQGPDNTPQKMAVYIEDGNLRPFSCVIETPRSNNAIAIRNTGHLEFPMAACVEPDAGDAVGEIPRKLAALGIPKTIQGGAIQTYPFSPAVSSVQVMLKTDGRPLNARIELLQGPNNNKQVMEVYTEDGLERPFFAVVETPGVGNVVRVVNTGTVEFPLSVSVEPYLVDSHLDENESVWDNDSSWDNGGGSFFFGKN
eukprot:CAMPEP_0198134460 /NCGR_PEP_ID=MMETSP1442-20131203/60087_1 /TAXON_ID= /ORGANISM="Craspedostauros australis, Strain CCMP3328" /LENGTH=388 /DNA_ID=CAMNT_0043795605 /DNA_START=58 /DNA_END=1224 /DNA_ORIENTATION=+